MRILMISPTSSGIGGTTQHVNGLSDFLRSKNHHVTIISSENTFTVPIKKLKNLSFMISSFVKTKFSGNYDIIHAHHPIASLSFKASSAKKIVTFHGVYSKQIGILHGNTASTFSNRYEKNALDWADAITTGSQEAFEFYNKLVSKVSFVPNAIDLNSLPIGSDTRYEKQIIFAGRLSKEKGILTILEIIKDLPSDIHLLIIGTGPEENIVKKSVANKENIHFLGYQPKEKTIPLIRGSTVLIQPSFAEGISGTLLEAMACKTPIIATNVGGNKELLGKKNVGILIEPGDSKTLLKKILELVSEKELLEKISTSAYAEVQKYDWSNVGQCYVDLYEKILQS
jgi:glycosyltransferase involved in cell wall biosynthesis